MSRPRWNRLSPDARRAQILETAHAAFRQRSYDEVSLTAIANAAGVSRALVTHYFGGKRELYLAVQRRTVERAEGAIRSDLELPIERTVERNVSAWLDFAERNRGIMLPLNSFSPEDREAEGDELAADLRDRLVDTMLVNHFGTTDVPGGTRLVLRAYTGMVEVAVSDWLVHGRATRAQVHTVMVRALLALVRDVAPAVADEPGPGAPPAERAGG